MTLTQKNAISSPNTPSQTGAHAPRGQLGLWKLLRLRRQQGRSGEELPPAPPPAEASCVSEVFSRALGNWAARGRAQARHRPPCPHRGGQLSGVEFPLVSVVLLRSCRRKRTWRVPAPSPLSPFLGGAPSPTPQATPEPALMTQVMKDLG